MRRETSIKLELPPSLAIIQSLGQNWAPVSQRISYTIHRPTQALRQATSLAKILAYPSISQDSVFSGIVSFEDSKPWLLDSLLDLRYVQKRWDSILRVSPNLIMQLVLDITERFECGNSAFVDCQRKSYALLVLLCSELISDPNRLVSADSAGEELRSVFCLALVAITKACLEYPSIGRLAASKLMDELSLLSRQHLAIGTDTDVWVWFSAATFEVVLMSFRVAQHFFDKLSIGHLAKAWMILSIHRNLKMHIFESVSRHLTSNSLTRPKNELQRGARSPSTR
jgi:serine/threonine-protein kinase ATR